MTVKETRKRMAGFKAWHNRHVRAEYKWTGSAKELQNFYMEELRNNGSIEIPGYQTKTGNPVLFW